jgi:hypothetical protein
VGYFALYLTSITGLLWIINGAVIYKYIRQLLIRFNYKRKHGEEYNNVKEESSEILNVAMGPDPRLAWLTQESVAYEFS